MNEKIKILARRAGFMLWQDEDWNPGDIIDWSARYDDEMVKFAELIVRECVRVCVDRGTHHDGLYSAWAEDCSKRIEKHFGVD